MGIRWKIARECCSVDIKSSTVSVNKTMLTKKSQPHECSQLTSSSEWKFSFLAASDQLSTSARNFSVSFLSSFSRSEPLRFWTTFPSAFDRSEINQSINELHQQAALRQQNTATRAMINTCKILLTFVWMHTCICLKKKMIISETQGASREENHHVFVMVLSHTD